MAYEKNQYSYFQNIRLDETGALVVNINGGARTGLSTPILYSAVTVETLGFMTIYVDLDGSLGNTFTIDFDILDAGSGADIQVVINSITNFNNGDNLYLTCNFTTPSETGVGFSFYFPTYLPTSSWTKSIITNYPKSISFNAPIWNNVWLFSNEFVEGILR